MDAVKEIFTSAADDVARVFRDIHGSDADIRENFRSSIYWFEPVVTFRASKYWFETVIACPSQYILVRNSSYLFEPVYTGSDTPTRVTPP